MKQLRKQLRIYSPLLWGLVPFFIATVLGGTMFIVGFQLIAGFFTSVGFWLSVLMIVKVIMDSMITGDKLLTLYKRCAPWSNLVLYSGGLLAASGIMTLIFPIQHTFSCGFVSGSAFSVGMVTIVTGFVLRKIRIALDDTGMW